MPAFGTAHSVKAMRTMRLRVPRDATIGLDIKQQTLNFVVSVPTEEDPVVAQVHATAYTAVENDSPATYRDSTNKDLLTESCPDCKVMATISKGEKFRESVSAKIIMCCRYIVVVNRHGETKWKSQ